MIDKKALIEAGIKYIYQLDDFPRNNLVLQVEKELDELLSLNSENVLESRLDYVGIGTKEDYLNQWIETSEGFVLAGIRHMGGNLEEPFVYMWPTFKIKNLKRVIEDLKPYFEIFKPKYYNFWIRPDQNDYDCQLVQQRFLATIDEMVKYDYELEKPEEYYSKYKYEYDLFHGEYPEFKDRVMVNDKEMMDECLNQDLLFIMKDQGQEVGLIAGEHEEFLGESAVYIDEILVFKRSRGKGYGAKLLGSFVNKLDKKYLICHIDSENKTSTKTALRAGEKVFSQECFVSL